MYSTAEKKVPDMRNKCAGTKINTYVFSLVKFD